MTEAEQQEAATFSISLCASTDLALNEQRRFNGGYLFLQDIYYELGLHRICRAIAARHQFKYDLNDILSRLIYTRILYPASKKSSFEDAQRFIERPSFELHDIYRALSVIAEESEYIQSRLFKTAQRLPPVRPKSSTTTVPTSISRLKKQRRTNNTASAKRTVPFQSLKWGCLWTGKESRSLSE